MRYQNLHELFFHSSGSRRYFLSLPIPMQLQVSEHSAGIHSAADLHDMVNRLERYNRAVANTERLTLFRRKPD